MKVLVLGDGLLGNEIIKQTNWDYLSRKKDGIDANNLNDWQHKLSPYDVIINCIAHTDTYSTEKKIHWEINFEFVSYLSKLCNKLGKKLVHISTDYIYAHSTPLSTENDVPVHLPTWYGYTKLLGDAHVQLVSDDYLICRLSHKPNPFPYPKAWSNMQTNCDYVDVIADLVIKLVNKNAFGVYNVGTEVKSIYELAKKTNNVVPIDRPTQVPEDTSMSINKLKETL
jgi:dTDP-4-dehydrorhamnose reductase